MESSTLQHHGIIGMKWGVRRYQNKDGSLTSAGKRRAASQRTSDMSDEELTAKIKRHNLEKAYDKIEKESGKNSKVEKTKKVLDASSNLVNQAKSLSKTSQPKPKMDLSSMTDQQLRERINRANLERQYNDLFGSEAATVSKGKKFVNNTLDVAGTVLAIGSSSLGIALAIKDLKK